MTWRETTSNTTRSESSTTAATTLPRGPSLTRYQSWWNIIRVCSLNSHCCSQYFAFACSKIISAVVYYLLFQLSNWMLSVHIMHFFIWDITRPKTVFLKHPHVDGHKKLTWVWAHWLRTSYWENPAAKLKQSTSLYLLFWRRCYYFRNSLRGLRLFATC